MIFSIIPPSEGMADSPLGGGIDSAIGAVPVDPCAHFPIPMTLLAWAWGLLHGVSRGLPEDPQIHSRKSQYRIEKRCMTPS